MRTFIASPVTRTEGIEDLLSQVSLLIEMALTASEAFFTSLSPISPRNRLKHQHLFLLSGFFPKTDVITSQFPFLATGEAIKVLTV